MGAVRRQLARQGKSFGKRKDEAAPPELPGEVAHLWVAFCELDATRGAGMGPGPITFAELDAYARVHGIVWVRTEIDLLRLLDREYLTRMAQAKPKIVKPPPAPPGGLARGR